MSARASEDFVEIGQGDDFILDENWAVPFSNFPLLFRTISECRNFEYDLPVRELRERFGGMVSLREIDHLEDHDAEEFLEWLFPEDFRIEREPWESGGPISGVIHTALMRAGAADHITKVLSAATDFLSEWRERSGLARKVVECDTARNTL